MKYKRFEDLPVWQDAIELSVSQIPPALAAWSLSFALGGSFGVTVRYHLLQQRGVSIFRY